jgi:hypothetical protein
MDTFSAESFAATLAIIGVVIIVSALLSGLIERSGLPQVAVFLTLGAALGTAQPLHVFRHHARTHEQDQRQQKTERRDNAHRLMQSLSAKRFKRLLCKLNNAAGGGCAGGEEIAGEPCPEWAERRARHVHREEVD